MVHHPSDSGPKRPSGQAGKDRKPRDSARGPKDAKAPAKPAGKGERVAKALARAGVASRREVERLIGLGKVAVNGRILATPAVLIQKDDILTVDGQVVSAPEATRVWRYHKPVGLMTTHRDPEGRPTVFETLPKGLPRVISVGRLDINSEGLLLLTNDGELSRALELPTTGWKRVYRARAHGRITQADLDRLKDGVEYEGVRYGPIEAKLDKAKESEGGSNVWITLSLGEGKYREVRKVLESLGLRVNRLIRLAYGPFQLGTLGLGEVEEIGPRVIREQLADLIPAENLPKGDKVLTPPPAGPSRRPIPGSAMANPKAKPSRVKENIAMREQREAERAARNAERNAGRPRRDGDRPYRPRDTEGAERPRGARSGDPKRDYGKPREDRGERPARAYGDRPRTGPGEKRPFKPRGDRPEGERSGGDRPSRPRPEGAGEARRDDRPRGPRPGWAKPRPEGERDDRPKRPYKPRDNAERGPAGEGAKRPYKPREGGDRPERSGDGAKRPYGGKPGAKPGGFKRGPSSRGPGGPGPGGPRPGGPKGPRKPRPE